ncbi:ANTAR domain-containing protein [Streptomyces sp. HG99]|uniref:ANTAR domain-containing protein n=1 Tax=Streptomyces sp. HG99 TaxID=1958787 RepID=UPI0027B98901|nr:ANTAR domain-containing protein [Streptomyces sp. HG99]
MRSTSSSAHRSRSARTTSRSPRRWPTWRPSQSCSSARWNSRTSRTASWETALTSRILVEQVKGVLAERWNASVDDAFAAFRSYARAHHLRLSELAARIVAGDFDTAAIPAPARPGGHQD